MGPGRCFHTVSWLNIPRELGVQGVPKSPEDEFGTWRPKKEGKPVGYDPDGGEWLLCFYENLGIG